MKGTTIGTRTEEEGSSTTATVQFFNEYIAKSRIRIASREYDSLSRHALR